MLEIELTTLRFADQRSFICAMWAENIDVSYERDKNTRKAQPQKLIVYGML